MNREYHLNAQKGVKIPFLGQVREKHRPRRFYIRKTLISSALAIVLMAGASSYANPLIDLAKISRIESSNNPEAISYKGAKYGRGLYQISEICLKEWNNYHPAEQFKPNQLFNPDINKKIAEWYLTVRIPEMLKYYGKPVTIKNILWAYSAGIGRVVKEYMPEETEEYIEKYKKLEEK